jgi:hypothetical protein
MPNHLKIDLETKEDLSELREIDVYPEMTQRM